jgi:DUF4097 and DUF4098 domain-containing protein YvlB
VILLFAVATPAQAHRIERKFNVEMRPVVVVKNEHGKIAVKVWDRSEVLIVAEHQSDKVEVDAEQMGNRIDVFTHIIGRNLTPAQLKADYEITVPKETELQISNDAGTIVVAGISGDMTFNTVMADVDVQEVYGYLVLKTVGGSLVCVRCAGKLEISTISGNVRLLQPVSSYIHAQTYSGSIFYDGAFLSSGVYKLKTTTGPIEVRYSEGDSFDLRAFSQGGRVDRDPGLNLRPPSHSRATPAAAGKSSSLVGTFGAGLARVELTSFSGTINIRRRE